MVSSYYELEDYIILIAIDMGAMYCVLGTCLCIVYQDRAVAISSTC